MQLTMQYPNKKTVFSAVIPLIIVGALASCAPDEKQKSETQVVAKVNGDEITIHQLNEELHKMSLKREVNDDMASKMLESLIDRQLLVQEAIKLNLDRTPEIVEAVNSAKSQIYAQAYLNRKMTKLPPPTEDELQQFIKEHSEIFAGRKVFTTQDIVFENEPAKINVSELETTVATSEQLKELLSAKGIQYTLVNNTFSTEMLSPDVLQKIKGVQVGDLLFAHDDSKVVVKSVIQIENIPTPDTQSTMIATKLLMQKKQQGFIVEELTRLKKLSKIDIMEKKLAVDQANMEHAGN